MKFIDISGVGHSGKAAAGDLLREIDGIFLPDFQFEFDFIRVRGGLLDFRHALVDDWSPVRSQAAYFAFKETIQHMGVNPSWWNIRSWMKSTSQRYDRVFEEQFIEVASAFGDSFINGKYKASWPYDDLKISGLSRLFRKIMGRLGLRTYLTRDVLLLDGVDFDQKARELLKNLYSYLTDENTTDFCAFFNGIEPFNPVAGLNMMGEGARQIVVVRDPRDMYVSGMNDHNLSESDRHLQSSDNDGLSKSFLATDNLDLFIKRYKLYNKQVYSSGDPRILKIRFEDLVINYDRVVPKILEFIDVNKDQHKRKKHFFNPAVSIKGIGLWKKYSKQDEIKYIEEELSEFLYERCVT